MKKNIILLFMMVLLFIVPTVFYPIGYERPVSGFDNSFTDAELRCGEGNAKLARNGLYACIDDSIITEEVED